MPISFVSRQPKLLTVHQRCDPAEFSVGGHKAKSTKSIRFNEIVSIRSTTHINDMTDEEIYCAWYTRKEMSRMKRRVAVDAKHMMAGSSMPSFSTQRGLEFRTPEGSAKRKANKFNSIHAVLDEQDAQQMHDHDDPEIIRRIYQQHSTHCLAEAQKLGKQDEIEAQKIFLNEAEDMEIDEEQKRRSLKREMFLRTFAKKSEVVEEIKQMTIECA